MLVGALRYRGHIWTGRSIEHLLVAGDYGNVVNRDPPLDTLFHQPLVDELIASDGGSGLCCQQYCSALLSHQLEPLCGKQKELLVTFVLNVLTLTYCVCDCVHAMVYKRRSEDNLLGV